MTIRVATTVLVFVATFAATTRRTAWELFTIPTSEQSRTTVAISSLENPSSRPQVSSDWRKVNAEDLFTFYLPPDFKQTDTVGIDSFFREYLRGDTRFIFVYEDGGLAYEARHTHGGNLATDADDGGIKDFQEMMLKIDGQPATIVTYNFEARDGKAYLADLYVGDWPHDKVKLTMSLRGKNSIDQNTAARVFNSIKFSRKFSRATR